MYITEVDIDVPDATIFFPEIEMNDWKLTEEEAHIAEGKNEYDYVFKTYLKK